MIKKNIHYVFFFLLIVHSNMMYGNDSSSKATIVGKIVDKETGTPLEFSTITLYNPADSLVITGGISDANGLFSIKTNHDLFFIQVEFIAYQTHTIQKIKLKKNQKLLDLGTIELSPDLDIISTIEVRAEKSSVIMKLDKRVFNVGKDLTSAGGTAEDILRNVPGVSIDVDGNIGLRSLGGVRILLNGRPSLLLGGESATGLRQIQANQIEYIEVITNPSSRYEAEGMAGIINIVLKNNQEKGLNGSMNANLGQPDNYGLGINMNYHKNKFNWFMGAGGWYINRPGTGSFRNEFYNSEQADSTVYSNMDRSHERQSLLGYFKFGADYYINPKNVLITSFSYRKSYDNNPTELIYKDAYGDPEDIFLITRRLEKETEEENNLSYLLTYKKLFSKKGQQFTTDVQYESRMEEEISMYEETLFDKNNIPLDTANFNQLSNNEEGNRQLIVRSDYIHPFSNGSKLELGFQASFRTIANDYRVREVINNLEIPDSNFTNKFNYHEVIHGVYGNFGKKIDRFSFQVGLRVEYADVETTLMITDEKNHRHYTNFFPSAFFTYDLPDDNALQLSYSRRIQRPTFWDLNPFFTVRDRRNIFKGNPNIEPELSHAFELGHIKYWEKGSISSIAYFRKTSNVIKRIQRVDVNAPERTITQAENLELKRNLGIEFTYSLMPTTWWRLNGDANFYHSLSEGTFEYAGNEIFVGGQSFSMSAKTSTRFTYWKKVNTQFTFSYSAPRTTTQGVNKSTTALDFACSIDLLKNNGTVTLNISDVFNSRRRRSFSEDLTFRSEDNFLWQTRSVVLSFNYRLNQQKNRSHIYLYPKDEDEDEQF